MLSIEKEKGISLSGRDFEILNFCLEMKFSDIESLDQKFFKNSFESSEIKSDEMFAARKRIQKLEAYGYLKSISLLAGSSKKYYLTTSKGSRALAQTEQSFILKPVTKLSQMTFEHDLMVLKSRLLLEKQKRAFEWKAERFIKAYSFEVTKKIARPFMPDGVFKSKNGAWCAFEYENKPKSEIQMREKVFRLKSVIDSSEDEVFKLCLFVTSTEQIKKRVTNITQMWPESFKVQSLSDLKELRH